MRVEKERTKKKKIKKKRVKDEEGKGSGKKNTKAKSPMKRERETESLVWERLFLQLCERLGGGAHQQNFWLFNLSIVMYK